MITFRKDKIFSVCTLLFFMVIILSGSVSAQQMKHHPGLEKVINPDGSIRSGVMGSFNSRGYDLEFGENNKPLFKKSRLEKTASESEWSALGTGRLGISYYDGYPGNVYAIAVNSEGDIYVGGEFAFAGDMIVANIARWDVSEGQWEALPCGSRNGVSGTVETIVIKGTDVYVGGTFVNLSDNTPVNYIAKFSETTNTWSALTDDDGGFCGVNFEVAPGSECGIYDMGFIDDVLYVGGEFFRLADGTTTAYRAAKYTGTDWEPLTGGSINGVGSSNKSSTDFVDALEVSGNKVYLGGRFTTLGDGTTAAKNIAVWDEDSDTWSSLTYNGVNGINGDIYDIKINGTTVYACGNFTKLGDASTNANYIAKWIDGSGWSALTSGSTYGVDNVVTTILIDGTDLYVTGKFTKLSDGSGTYNRIARWNGSAWSAVANGSNSIIGIAGPYTVYALEKSGDNYYTGGVFMYLGDNTTVVNSLTVWNKTAATWGTFGSGDNGVDGAVRAIAVNGDYIYVGGYFKTINGGTISAKHIARWNYNTKLWSLISSATTGIDVTGSSRIFAMAVGGNYLYVAGTFSSINGGTAANNIARYNLSDGTWSALSDGTNTGVSAKVATISVIGNDVYIGGDFTTLSGGASARYAAKWNESTDTWSAVSDGVTNGTGNRVLSSAVNGNLVYFGGYFNNLACWNSTSSAWVTMMDPEGYYPYLVRSIALDGNEIYIACDTYGETIAKWDDTNGWTVLNADLKIPTPPIYSLAFSGGNLYATGGFTTLNNGDFVNGLIKWNSTDGWHTLTVPGSTATGINGIGYYGYAMAVNTTEGKMYIGGIFSTAGDKGAFNIASFTDADNPLPVELKSFTAASSGNSIELKWQTDTEVNNYGFEVERASLGTTPGQGGWEKIGFVNGAGNSNSPKEYSFADENPPAGIVQYRLKQINTNGSSKYYSKVAEVNYLTGVDEKQLPAEFALDQNYPNPFNPTTKINYAVGKVSAGNNSNSSLQFVSLKIYDILGNEVATLVNEYKAPGYYEVEFSAGSLATGVYIYRITASEFSATKKLMLMK